MRPLIKYTGGKYKEYEIFKNILPDLINNYYEPFAGGCGVFFRLNEDKKIKGKSYINDYSNDLMDFYRSVCDRGFKKELYKLSDAWEMVSVFSDDFCIKYGDLFMDVILGKKEKNEFINKDLFEYIENGLDKIGSIINLHGFDISKRVYKSIENKTNRFIKKDILVDDLEVPRNSLSTAIFQGFYFIIRDMYNDWNNHGNRNKYKLNERSSHWFFIREYCFGSMFRFSSNGDFNVPYGGLSYNNKCFRCKVDKIISNEAYDLFSNSVLENKDFEDAMDKEYEENDFIFLDPPYDSTFSEYDNNGFTREDHKRLANLLKNIKCKWLMAIGKTDFIFDLYKDFANIQEYDKTYMYQARGTYDNKKTKHLIIKNF